MAVVTVSYPAGEPFDMDYYLGTHMPMVHARWDGMGLQAARVLRGVAGPDGSSPANQVVTLLTFETMDKFRAAAAAHGPELFGDVPNFTKAKPAVQFNEVAQG